MASLPARGGGTAPSIRASAASGRRKVSSSPLRDVLMTTGPKAASPPPTEALSGQQRRLLPGGCPSLPLEAQGASMATGHSPSRPFPRAWGEIPSPRLCGSGWIQLQGHTQPVTAPQTLSPDAGSCFCSPTTGKGVVPPLNQEESPPSSLWCPKSSTPGAQINPGTRCQRAHLRASWKIPKNQLLPGGIGGDKSLGAEEGAGTAASAAGLSDP